MMLTDKQEQVLNELHISDIINYFGEDEILSNFSSLDIALNYDLDDILDQYSSKDDIAEYLFDYGYDFSKYIETDDVKNVSDESLLIEFCRRLHPNGVLTKEDIREIVNEYIDDMTNNAY